MEVYLYGVCLSLHDGKRNEQYGRISLEDFEFECSRRRGMGTIIDISDGDCGVFYGR